mmetsp:Transcript_9253/g.29372  ORF Transcript_9253/g.29372 Transcript_9253/m.29372 type:complete len:386 (+) Transcript_9253:447-1604(+)
MLRRRDCAEAYPRLARRVVRAVHQHRHPDGLHRRLGALRSARWHRLAADDWAGRCAARGRPARDAVHARVAALPPRSWPRGRGGASLVPDLRACRGGSRPAGDARGGGQARRSWFGRRAAHDGTAGPLCARATHAPARACRAHDRLPPASLRRRGGDLLHARGHGGCRGRGRGVAAAGHDRHGRRQGECDRCRRGGRGPVRTQAAPRRLKRGDCRRAAPPVCQLCVRRHAVGRPGRPVPLHGNLLRRGWPLHVAAHPRVVPSRREGRRRRHRHLHQPHGRRGDRARLLLPDPHPHPRRHLPLLRDVRGRGRGIHLGVRGRDEGPLARGDPLGAAAFERCRGSCSCCRGGPCQDCPSQVRISPLAQGAGGGSIWLFGEVRCVFYVF